MKSRKPGDTTAVPGSAYGGKTQAEADNVVSINDNQTFLGAATNAAKVVGYHLDSLADPNRSPRYAADPSVNYYANGSLSIMSRAGNLLFAKDSMASTNGLFRLDQGNNQLFSSMNSTLLGSKEIETVDGKEMHPQGDYFPSTMYSPKKTWYQKLFPMLPIKNMAYIAMLEVAQSMLFKAIAKSNRDEVNILGSDTPNVTDMGQIIIDNEEQFL